MKILKTFFIFLSFCFIPYSHALPQANLIINLENIKKSPEDIDNKHLLNQKFLLKQNKSNLSFQNTDQSSLIRESIKQNLKNNRSINQQSPLKNNFNISFKTNFKDLSKTYVSPFGKPIDRAPDESLINCQSKECYD